MGKKMKVRCTGPNKHVNEVDLDDALREDPLARRGGASSAPAPERVVLRCRECVDGRVILTRAMIEEARQQNP